MVLKTGQHRLLVTSHKNPVAQPFVQDPPELSAAHVGQQMSSVVSQVNPIEQAPLAHGPAEFVAAQVTVAQQIVPPIQVCPVGHAPDTQGPTLRWPVGHVTPQQSVSP
jgi:predicted lipid-binding transport protein (Tim44 family)